MVKFEREGKEYYIDGLLKTNLDSLKQAVEKKWDGVGFICGYEGDGKSVFTNQMAFYLDPTYNIDRCVFTGKQFVDAVANAKPFQAIVFDEAHNAFANSNRYDEINRLIITQLTMIRKKQLFLFIVAPTFFDLRKYLVIHRSRFMVQIYSNGLTRGFFRFFNRTAKHLLYIKGKKDENMMAIKPNLIGRFTKYFPLNEDEYENKKDEATASIMDSKTNNAHLRLKDYRIGCGDRLRKLLFTKFNVKVLVKDAAYIFNVTEGTIKNDRNAINKINADINDTLDNGYDFGQKEV